MNVFSIFISVVFNPNCCAERQFANSTRHGAQVTSSGKKVMFSFFLFAVSEFKYLQLTRHGQDNHDIEAATF
jgi:hypothetical protein